MDRGEKKIPLVAVVGPTASGKTGLAVQLALALGGEVVSADSMQVYRHMDIATAKPTAEEQRGVPHHLIDFLEPDASFSVADYARLAHAAIADIHARGRLAILAGGTGLYVDAVVQNIDYAPIESDGTVRRELEELAGERGDAYVYELLCRVDPACAAALHPHNRGRVLRALEVFRLTGVPMSEHQRRSRLAGPRYDACILGLCFSERTLLYERIDRRVDLMLEAGLVQEAAEVARIYGGTARQAIGYKELEPYLAGALPLEACVRRLKQATRNYAKRQLTWFRRDGQIQWLTVDRFKNEKELLETAQNVIHNALDM